MHMHLICVQGQGDNLAPPAFLFWAGSTRAKGEATVTARIHADVSKTVNNGVDHTRLVAILLPCSRREPDGGAKCKVFRYTKHLRRVVQPARL